MAQGINANAGAAQKVQLDSSAILDNAQRAVLQDAELRKLVQQFHPQGAPGAVVVKVAEGKRPLRLEEIFVPSNFVFMSPDAIGAKWPYYKNTYPDEFKQLYLRDSHTRFNVFYHFPIPEEALHSIPAEMREQARTMVQVGYYARWRPDAIFVTEEGIKRNVLELSHQTEKVVDDPLKAPQLARKLGEVYVDRCAYSKCPNTEKFILARLSKTGEAPPKLQYCSDCRVNNLWLC